MVGTGYYRTYRTLRGLFFSNPQASGCWEEKGATGNLLLELLQSREQVEDKDSKYSVCLKDVAVFIHSLRWMQRVEEVKAGLGKKASTVVSFPDCD